MKGGCRSCGAKLWVVYDRRYPDVCRSCLRIWLPFEPPYNGGRRSAR